MFDLMGAKRHMGWTSIIIILQIHNHMSWLNSDLSINVAMLTIAKTIIWVIYAGNKKDTLHVGHFQVLFSGPKACRYFSRKEKQQRLAINQSSLPRAFRCGRFVLILHGLFLQTLPGGDFRLHHNDVTTMQSRFHGVVHASPYVTSIPSPPRLRTQCTPNSKGRQVAD